MAAEMLEKILEAEKQAADKLKEAEGQAREVTEQAEKDAKAVLDAAKEKLQGEVLLFDKKNTEYAQTLTAAKREEAQKDAALMAEKASAKSKESVDAVINILVG